MKHPSLMIAAAAIVVSTVALSHSDAHGYPARPVRLIVPTSAGSNPDQLARLVAQWLSGSLQQSVIIDNRPGAGGTIGLRMVSSANADGHTLGIQTLPFIITPSLLASVPYDTLNDLAPVTLVNWNYSVLVVPSSSPARSVAELIAMSRAKTGGVTFSSAGNATPSHLVLALLARQSGANFVHVPYKGGPASIGAVLAGDVDVTVGGTTNLGPYIKAGKLRALATAAPKRLASQAHLPTLVELGYSGVELSDWQGIVAPRGTPREIIELLHSIVVQSLRQGETRRGLEALGMEPAGLGPQKFASYMRQEAQKWSQLVREIGLKAD